HGAYGVRVQRGVSHHASGAEPIPSYLELRFDHEREVGVGRGAAGECGQHQRQRDEREVADDEFRRLAADLLQRQITYIGSINDDYARIGLQSPDQLPVADVDRDYLPASRQRRPSTMSPAGPNAASAPASLCPPRDA